MLPVPAPAIWHSLRLLGVAAAFPAALLAQSATSLPVGAMRVTLNAGSPTAPALTAFAVPLSSPASNDGVAAGRVTAFTADTFTVSGAGWLPGALASTQAPFALRITRGTAAGLSFRVVSNTVDTLTITGGDLTAIGMVVGDRFELLPLDTLGTFFPANSIVGGTSPETADIIYVGAHTQDGYFFNTTAKQWRRAVGRSSEDCSNVALLPGAVVQIAHTSAAVTLTFVGRVPTTPFRADVVRSGNTFTHTGFPIDVTVKNLALQGLVPGWVSGASAGSADLLSLRVGGRWLSVYFNGTNWIDAANGATIADQTVIPAGTAVVIRRAGSASGFTSMNRELPYPL